MPRYNAHSLQLSDAEEAKLNAVKKSTGFGVKKIFMAMVEALLPKDDSIGDGKNKSAIVLNVEE